jgi:fatty-acyl-CoA synthase
MSDPLYASPTACGQTLRALARYPSRVAFSWPGGSITYTGATELIGRFQKVFMQLGLEPGVRVAFLTANRADTWCAGVAAQLSRLAITWLHPLGSLDDQLFQIEDSEARILVIDADTFRDRGGDLATRASSLKMSSRSARPITASICLPRSIALARRRRVVLPAPTISRR